MCASTATMSARSPRPASDIQKAALLKIPGVAPASGQGGPRADHSYFYVLKGRMGVRAARNPKQAESACGVSRSECLGSPSAPRLSGEGSGVSLDIPRGHVTAALLTGC